MAPLFVYFKINMTSVSSPPTKTNVESKPALYYSVADYSTSKQVSLIKIQVVKKKVDSG